MQDVDFVRGRRWVIIVRDTGPLCRTKKKQYLLANHDDGSHHKMWRKDSMSCFLDRVLMAGV